jgi:RNA polymerase sigma-70 factor (ECF subfamily)
VAEDESQEQSELSNPGNWVDLYGDQMFRYAVARLGDPHLAEDTVQETLLAGLHGRKEFRGRSSERTWLLAILRRKVVDAIRRLSRQRSSSQPLGEDGVVDGLFRSDGHWTGGPSPWDADPHALLERREFRTVLRRCLAGLPKRLRQVFMLREFDAMSSRQIQSVMAISPSNLWTMLHRARLRLRECLEANWFAHQEGAE